MKKLQVVYVGWGERWPLGTLADTGRQVLFEYTREAREAALELSPLHAPLAQVGATLGAPFFMGLPGFIADALPDGWGLLLMDRAFRKAGINPLSITPLDRLAFIGERAMGALVFEPADVDVIAGQDDSPNLPLRTLAQDAARVLTHENADEALRHLLLIGGSPQGARPKVLVGYDPQQRKVSTGKTDRTDGTVASGEPWLIKFPAGDEHRDACAIEALYAALARHCGLSMPPSHFFELDGKYSAFGVRRFDREGGARVPLQSVSAVLHIDYRLPALDYEMLLRLTRRMTGDEREVGKAFERCVFNVLTHNRDDHSRNFAFVLNRNRHWQLAPAFDLTFNEGPRGEHFTSVVGEGRAPAHSHLLELARRGGVPPGFAQATIDRLADAMSALPELAKAFPIRKTRLTQLRQLLDADRQRVVSG